MARRTKRVAGGSTLTLAERAGLHAALGEVARLAVVDELLTSDRSPAELGERLAMRSNLLARHLDVLEGVGLIVRTPSAADGRRKYVQLRLDRLALVHPVVLPVPDRVLFVCTQNAARSPLAAALWRRHTGGAAASAGVRPAERVHPGAVAAAERAGVRLGGIVPRHLAEPGGVEPGTQVITVCDQVHEELVTPAGWWHWSLPDPVRVGTRRAFDATAQRLIDRIAPFATPTR